ncbi:MAG: TonB-dependent receptor [Planctomycetaceae bacterium]|nr:TonB-dependent receptor [Planctomycetaceae bacterium]
MRSMVTASRGLLLSWLTIFGVVASAQESDNPFRLVQFQPPEPLQPRERESAVEEAPARLKLPEDLFGGVNQVDRLPPHRRRLATSPAASAVFGSESKGRVSNDVGNLLRKAISAHGVSTQDRTPIVSETRIRGQRTGQVLASGSYWTPVRADLDTMMNKIDSRLLEDVVIIKGPYSPRYGPGFRFVDFNLIETPRFEQYETHGSTSFDYDTNGEQSYGRQTLLGGSQDWGFRVSYGHRTGTDYETGDGRDIPASYKSRDLFFALGWDRGEHERFEFNYLRLDQTDLEFPGLVYDINFLVTNGYELKYVNTNPLIGDRLDSEVWYNETRFEGDTLNSGKTKQIPTLPTILFSPSGFDGFAITDAEGQSMGYRVETTFAEADGTQTSVGFDITHLRQHLNDIEPLIPDPDDNNFPIPPSQSTDVGLYWEEVAPVSDVVTLTAGGRIDFVTTQANNNVDGVPITISDNLWVDSLNRDFFLWSAFLTAEIAVNDHWTVTMGAGHGQRPPTLTELYTNSSFIGSLQPGLTALMGDPELRKERLTQLDFGIQGNFENARLGAHGYFSWVNDLITYDLMTPAGGAGGLGGLPQAAQFLNTDRAIIAGFETYAEVDVQPWLTTFGTMSYIEGRDLSRDEPSRFGFFDRSGVFDRNHESLPGIVPLETRLGVRLQDPSAERTWGVEVSARIVDDQDRIAASLGEIETPGFTTYDIRAFRRHGPWLLTAGIENFTNKNYREHLDYRSGLGVFRPGINFYSGVELNY